MSQKITTLVLPVAGRGVRLLPLTLTTPKALVPVLNKPLLLYIIEEAALSGIKDIVLVTSPDTNDVFQEFLDSVAKHFSGIVFHLYDQKDPWGHGRAVLTAYDFLKGRPFIIRFSDDLIFHEKPVLRSLINLFDVHNRPIILLEPVPFERASSYGIVGVKESLSSDLHDISEFIEKPATPPSNLSVVGGYVFTPELLEHLKKAEEAAPKASDGLLVSDAFHPEIAEGGKILGWQFPGQRFDCGSLEGIKAAEEFLKQKSAV